MDEPRWLTEAWRELGTREAAGSGDNQRILQYFREVGHPDITHDATAWCAAFAGACLSRAGEASTGSLLARSYAGWGDDAAGERLGAVVVLKRGSDPTAGHVGFLVGATEDEVILIGGNQGNAVSVAAFARGDVIAMRWPAARTAAKTGADENADPGFAAALAHVLEMEGGYTDDPADPGGPTNFGLTLTDLAAERGVAVATANRSALLADLRAITTDEVRGIYAKRYWVPSRAADLPAGLALMHFDAAVNMGLGTAARLLQQAVGAEADGEIGPRTLAAALQADAGAAIGRYADLRRDRYRALAGFARFGRGWLNRVAATERLALSLVVEKSQATKGESTMSNASTADTTAKTDAGSSAPADPKWWGQSMTVWGTLITAVATVAPVLGPLIGIDISSDTVRQVGGQTAEVMRGIAGLAGTLLALYGRTRAAAPLMRRDFSLRL